MTTRFYGRRLRTVWPLTAKPYGDYRDQCFSGGKGIAENGGRPRQDIIRGNLQPIIMKAAGMKDESNGPRENNGDQEESPFLSRIRNGANGPKGKTS